MKPTNYLFSTGHVDGIKPEHAARRFIAVPAKQTIHAAPLDLPQLCDICGRRRNQGNHQRCSKLRQQIRRRQQQ
ncbi:MAG: hypothetical protein V7756_04705 [Halopseudomonas sp.]|uniref:hypothetical protein n=1 Tax=Halopseudomonas sp. TaxID=2901191 RepID=UPI0030031700